MVWCASCIKARFVRGVSSLLRAPPPSPPQPAPAPATQRATHSKLRTGHASGRALSAAHGRSCCRRRSWPCMRSGQCKGKGKGGEAPERRHCKAAAVTTLRLHLRNRLCTSIALRFSRPQGAGRARSQARPITGRRRGGRRRVLPHPPPKRALGCSGASPAVLPVVRALIDYLLPARVFALWTMSLQ